MEETIHLIDAGLLVNVPYPSFLGDRRDIDLIIAPEYSAGDMFEVAQKCIYVCLKCELPLIWFWTVLFFRVNHSVITVDKVFWAVFPMQTLHYLWFNSNTDQWKVPHLLMLDLWHGMTFTSSRWHGIPRLHPSDSDSGQRLRSCSQEALPKHRWQNPGGERLAQGLLRVWGKREGAHHCLHAALQQTQHQRFV